MFFLSRLVRDIRGNTAVMFGLTMIPIVGAVGAGIDYSRVVEVRSHLSEALDAGVLAVARRTKVSDGEALMIVSQWVDTHMPKADATWRVDSVTRDADGGITGYASAKVQTTIARIIGIDEVPISVKSQAMPSLAKAGDSTKKPPPAP